MEFIILIGIIIAIILIVRLFGAWMLRINDVINELKGLRNDLRSLENDYLIKKSEPNKNIEQSDSEIKTSIKVDDVKSDVSKSEQNEQSDLNKSKSDYTQIAILAIVIIVIFILYYFK